MIVGINLAATWGAGRKNEKTPRQAPEESEPSAHQPESDRENDPASNTSKTSRTESSSDSSREGGVLTRVHAIIVVGRWPQNPPDAKNDALRRVFAGPGYVWHRGSYHPLAATLMLTRQSEANTGSLGTLGNQLPHGQQALPCFKEGSGCVFHLGQAGAR